MKTLIDDSDRAFLSVGTKKYFCNLFSILSHCDDVNIIYRNGIVEEFILNLPREEAGRPPFRVKFRLRNYLWTHDFDYYRFKPEVTQDGKIASLLQELLDQDKTMAAVRPVASFDNMYRL